MSITHLFRIDDISWDMNYENFCKIRDLFIKYDIRPIIGVIPCNKDEKLKKQVGEYQIGEERFWHEMRELQQKYGWAIALHGYDHVYITNDSGIFRINKRAEFAGVPYEQQEEKIRLGKAVLEENGLMIDAFMAPAHSLDWNTIEALKKNGITVVTDGIALFPYRKKGVLFIPQVWAWPRGFFLGTYTACFHINSWGNDLFEKLEVFIQNNQRKIGTFQDAVEKAEKEVPAWQKGANVGGYIVISVMKQGREILSKIKRKYVGGGE